MALTFKHGKSAYFKISVTGSTIVLSSGLDDISYDREVETADVTTFGDGDRNFLPGLRTGTFQVSGHWASTYEIGIHPLLGGSTLVTARYGPQGSGTGSPYRQVSTIITNYSVGSPVDDKVSMSLTFQMSGSVSTGTF